VIVMNDRQFRVTFGVEKVVKCSSKEDAEALAGRLGWSKFEDNAGMSDYEYVGFVVEEQ